MKIYENLSKEQIIKIIEESNTYDEALVLLGYKTNKANRKIIKELAKQYNLSLDLVFFITVNRPNLCPR